MRRTLTVTGGDLTNPNRNQLRGLNANPDCNLFPSSRQNDIHLFKQIFKIDAIHVEGIVVKCRSAAGNKLNTTMLDKFKRGNKHARIKS